MMADNTPAIEVKGLTKSFGNQHALDGFDLIVEWGKTLAIFGPNGAGKTTLIKILASITKPSTGEVFINGLNLKDNADFIRSQIGIVSHQVFLYGNLTAHENLVFYSRMYDIADYKKRIHQVVSMLGMQSRLYDRIGTLSRGMQQRFSIARCLLHKPSIILLDEPETGLDQQAISMLWRALKEDGSEKLTIVFTSHSLERGLNTCDNFIILSKGKIAHQQPSKGLSLVGLQEIYRDCTGAGSENTK
ncbi:MAG: ABC transporter ATP-binding protein [Dehalococcoidia bacterium]|nr:MAG: ABC transporter ATP-binding protein [Dehalococcoidia bacterium]